MFHDSLCADCSSTTNTWKTCYRYSLIYITAKFLYCIFTLTSNSLYLGKWYILGWFFVFFYFLFYFLLYYKQATFYYQNQRSVSTNLGIWPTVSLSPLCFNYPQIGPTRKWFDNFFIACIWNNSGSMPNNNLSASSGLDYLSNIS